MKKRVILSILLAALAAAAVLGILVWNGVIQLNHPSGAAYPVRGVDVSHYQGTVDWGAIEAQGVRFAYIKATEGSSHRDDRFPANWESISRTGLRAGAYHFFSFESPGKTQAENFLETVEAVDGMLPPVLDVEPYGQYKSITDAGEAAGEIRGWLDAVEAGYGVKPVIYTTEAFYRSLVSKAFADYDVWIRSVYKAPPKDIPWTFWQYSNRARLDGCDGPERFIDMNVFDGSEAAFEAYGRAAGNEQ